ncbi:MAG: ABC transporter permease [Gemmatimonadales bacterium]
MIETLAADLRFAGRMLRKSPVFTLVAALCIALGSGAVTTIFSAMNALVLRPLPGVTDAARLVRMERKAPGRPDGISASYPFYESLRDRSRTLDGVAAWGKVSLTLASGGRDAASVYGNFVSENFFAVLGVHPALGRFFSSDRDTARLTDPLIVVSSTFWRKRLGSDSGAIGRMILVNGNPFTLIGVTPAAFQGVDSPIRTDAWVPLAMQRQLAPARRELSDVTGLWLRLAGRLKHGVRSEDAQRELSALTAARAADAAEPASFGEYSELRLSTLTGLPPDAKGPLAGFLGVLLGAAALVLIIASVNVASMLSARAIARAREMAVRAALGARRGRLIRQLLTEILVLFALGAAGGVAVAFASTRMLERVSVPGTLVFSFDLSPDIRVLVFALVISLVTGLVFGLAPALQAARADIATRLRADSAASGARRGLMSNALVVGQMALSLTLLVAAGLFLRALESGRRVDPGFDVTGVAVASFDAESWGYDEVRGRILFRALRDQVAGLPGVTAVSYSAFVPLSMRSDGDNIQVDGVDAPERTRGGESAGGVPVRLADVDVDYFTALRIPLLGGRSFTLEDDAHTPRVAVVNETLARRYWPGGDAVGHTFGLHGDRVTIVGVARDAKYGSLNETTPPFVYFPMAQAWRATQALLIRSDAGPQALAPAIQRAVRSLDPALPRPEVTSLSEASSIVLLPQRVAAMVTGALGAVGLLLATVGLYGITSYSTTRRTREIGVRMALGARQSDVLRLIVRDGMRLVVTGVAIGLVFAAAVTRLIVGFLFGASPLDAVTFGGMSILLSGVALLACWLPARRAAAANPVTALRAE